MQAQHQPGVSGGVHLASLWDPDVAISKNAAFVARAKELNSEFELELTALMETRSQSAASDDQESHVEAEGD